MEPVFWHWLILGAILVAVEILTPGFVFFWLGVSAVLTGLVVAAAPPLDWRWQVLVFAVLAIASVAGWLAWWRRRPQPEPGPGEVNRGAARLVGRTGMLEQAIGPGNGRLRLGDTTWPATGAPLPAGTAVRVVAADGGLLHVEPTPAPPP